jgi:C_GCAxxG_C_C family probable redox protein
MTVILFQDNLEMSRHGGVVMNNVTRTVELFSSGLTCSQAILAVFGETHGLDAETGHKLGRSLAGGLGRLGRTCGAVTGAALVLGLAKDAQDEAEARTKSWSFVQELVRRFEEVHGTSACRDLLGADLLTDEGQEKIREGQLITKLCPGFVKTASEILEGLLASSGDPRLVTSRCACQK